MDLEILQTLILNLYKNTQNYMIPYIFVSVNILLIINTILINKKVVNVRTIKKYYIDQDTQTNKETELKKIGTNLYESQITKKDLGISTSPEPPSITRKPSPKRGYFDWWNGKYY